MTTNYDQPMSYLYPLGEGVYNGISRNVCHKKSLLQFAILPISANVNVVCSFSP